MKPELIVMLTHHDRTVQNALEMFQEMRDTPIRHWGFKDVGLPPDEMKSLVRCIKDAGKTAHLEVVSLTEEEVMAGAKIAVESGFDYLVGTVCFDSVLEYMKDKPTKYCPFPGHVHSHPSILDGTIEEIVDHARSLEAKGVAGLDLLAYRFVGDADNLLCKVVEAVNIPVIAAGSIASYERIARVWKSSTWGFTIGSAFFEKKFAPNGDFKENMMVVWNWLEETKETDLDSYVRSPVAG
jgi:hypothetical protein